MPGIFNYLVTRRKTSSFFILYKIILHPLPAELKLFVGCDRYAYQYLRA